MCLEFYKRPRKKGRELLFMAQKDFLNLESGLYSKGPHLDEIISFNFSIGLVFCVLGH